MEIHKFDPSNEKFVIIPLEITVEDIQDSAETHIGRILTAVELNRIHQEWYAIEELSCALHDIIKGAVDMVTDPEDTEWNKIDEEFLKDQNK